MPSLVDITGQKFGKLTALRHSPARVDGVCRCGIVDRDHSNQRESQSWRSRSCGCAIGKESPLNRTHGQARKIPEMASMDRGCADAVETITNRTTTAAGSGFAIAGRILSCFSRIWIPTVAAAYARTHRQRRRLRAQQLSLGDPKRPGQQSTKSEVLNPPCQPLDDSFAAGGGAGRRLVALFQPREIGHVIAIVGIGGDESF